MENISTVFDKYKYHIGGSGILFIILYAIYEHYADKASIQDKEKENSIVVQTKPEEKFVKAELSHDEFMIFMKTLKTELQNLTMSLVKFNANQIKQKDYKDFRDKLFTKDIIKKSILVDSISAYQDGQKTSNYIVNFGGDNSPEVFKNVIGFRLINAIVPYTVYTVNDNNKNIKIDSTSFDLVPGSYTFTQLGDHLQTRINATALTGYTVTSDTTTYKYTISHASSFTIKWSEVSGYSYRLFGFEKEDTSGSTNTYTSTYSVDHSIHYADLVIDEIPSIACKMSSKGKQIIARIPFNNASGGLIYYRAPEGELQTSNYFYPMKLSSLSIKLFDDNGNEYDSNNGDNYFEFEITIVENTELFK
tara:strand:- start:3482 stop:4567 length:1086 start_codon:yes stop_codon:yes gene_type:complete